MTTNDTADIIWRTFDAHVDQRLASAAATPTPRSPTRDGLMALAANRPPRRRRARLVVVAALVVIMAGGAAVAVEQVRRSTAAHAHRTSATAGLDLTETYSTVGDFTFAHPAFLRWVPPGPPSAGLSNPIGYLTNAATTDPCTSSGPDSNGSSSLTCGSPVTALQPGQLVVTFTGIGLLNPELLAHPNTTVAGLPATVSDQAPSNACPSGGTTALIALPATNPQDTGTSAFEVSSCVNNTPSSVFDIQRLLDSAEYEGG